jgi:Na+-translocating ferredoxin:NAD+ oxidoreductase RnfE subunit
MSLALTAVTASQRGHRAIRHHIPNNIRIIVQMTIIASLVIVVDGAQGLCARDQQAVVGVRRPDHHQLHRAPAAPRPAP